ncbi:MAG TPA: hypothetical protein VN442_09745 [Bryobacteraceae bacterium]|nr:hypothetical protein [Bryobacteraceae bacterium]
MRLAFSAMLLLAASAKEFLQLSDSQLETILANNGEYNRFSQEKQTRIRQV